MGSVAIALMAPETGFVGLVSPCVWPLVVGPGPCSIQVDDKAGEFLAMLRQTSMTSRHTMRALALNIELRLLPTTHSMRCIAFSLLPVVLDVLSGRPADIPVKDGDPVLCRWWHLLSRNSKPVREGEQGSAPLRAVAVMRTGGVVLLEPSVQIGLELIRFPGVIEHVDSLECLAEAEKTHRILTGDQLRCSRLLFCVKQSSSLPHRQPRLAVAMKARIHGR